MGESRSLRSQARDQVLDALASLGERRRGQRWLAILTYHRVSPTGEHPDLLPGLAVSPERFAEHIAVVAERTEPVSIDQLLAAADGGPKLPDRAVHVTFDDGYACVGEHAWPVLRAAGVPATMFVPTSYPDQQRCFWWDRLQNAVFAATGPELHAGGRCWPITTRVEREVARDAVKEMVAERPHRDAMALVDELVDEVGDGPAQPATSSWAELRRLADEGLAIGSHTRTHPMLDRIDPDQLEEEITGSLRDLAAHLGAPAVPALAYPGGHLDDIAVCAAERAGVRLGFTTSRGVVSNGSDPSWLRLPRINVGRRATAPLVRAQLRPEAHRAFDLVQTTARGGPNRHHRPTPRRVSWN